MALVQGARTLAAFHGRDFAVPDDVVEIALPALRHRVILTAEAEVEGHQVDELLLEAVRSGTLRRRDAALIYATRVLGFSPAEVAEREQRDVRAVRAQRSRAERLLAAAVS